MKSTARRQSYGVKGAPYAFLLPAALLFTLFFALPIGYAVWLSFRKVKVSGLGLGSGARKEVWAGLENYSDALTDSELMQGPCACWATAASSYPSCSASPCCSR